MAKPVSYTHLDVYKRQNKCSFEFVNITVIIWKLLGFQKYSFSYNFLIFFTMARLIPYWYTNRRHFRWSWILLGGDDSLYVSDSDSDGKLDICHDELQSSDEVSVYSINCSKKMLNIIIQIINNQKQKRQSVSVKSQWQKQ